MAELLTPDTSHAEPPQRSRRWAWRPPSRSVPSCYGCPACHESSDPSLKANLLVPIACASPPSDAVTTTSFDFSPVPPVMCMSPAGDDQRSWERGRSGRAVWRVVYVVACRFGGGQFGHTLPVPHGWQLTVEQQGD
jgi:hypothetical protein